MQCWEVVRICDVLGDGSVVCTNDSLNDGDDCLDGEQGQCFRGNCLPIITPCGSNADCDDGNSCTVDECGPLSVCSNDPLPNGSPCIGENGECFLGSCLGFGF